MTFQKGHKPMGRAIKGHRVLETTKEKIRQSRLGKSSWNKGIPHSKKVREKMSRNHSDVSGKNNPMFGIKRIQLKGKNSPSYKNGMGHYRERALTFYESKCSRCLITDERLLLVHHKDRNRENNEIENFEILCRNCHSLEHWEEHRNKVLESIKRRKVN